MAEIEDQTLFSEYLYEGITSLKLHPSFKTQRKRRDQAGSASHTAESYLDKISQIVGISPNTLKSWIGQMGKKYIPSRIDDSKLFSTFWIILRYTQHDITWFHNIMKTTSIPVLDVPTKSWLKACMQKAKIKFDDLTFRTPLADDIQEVLNRIFPEQQELESTIYKDQQHDQLTAIQGTSNHLLEQETMTPHNLPNRSIINFVGRNMHAQLLNNWLNSNNSICLINGLGGMGKSTLALEIAYACSKHKNHFNGIIEQWPNFSNIIWVSADLKNISFDYFLDTIAYQLGKVELLEHSLNEKQFIVKNALFTTAQAGNILIIIDNVNNTNVDILSFILNLPSNIKILLTSRDHEMNLFNMNTRNVFSITLEGFEADEASIYVKDEIQKQYEQSLSETKRTQLMNMINAHHSQLMELATILAGNPKAIELSIAYIADAHIELQTFIDEIKASSLSINSIFDYIFGHTWSSASEEVKKLWIVLHFFQTPPDEDSWAKTAGLDLKSFYAAVAEMKAHALISAYRHKQVTYYEAHHTVIAYGEHQALEHPTFLDASKERWANYYLDYIDTALRKVEITHEYWRYLPTTKIATVKQNWLKIYQVLQWADQQHQHELLIQLMLKLSHFLSRVSLPIRIEYGLKAAHAANLLKNWKYEVLFRIDTVAWACYELGDNEIAFRHLHYALKLLEQHRSTITDEDKDEFNSLFALTYQSLTRYYIAKNDLETARKYIQIALEATQSPIITHRTLLVYGNLLMLEQRYEEAKQALEEAFNISNTYGEDFSIESCYFLGLAYLRCNELDRAQETFNILKRDEQNINQIELIYYQFGIAQLLVYKHEQEEAITLLESTLQLIDSWEQGIRVRSEVIQLLDQLQLQEKKLPLN